MDLGYWRYALNGAETISAVVQERFAARFAGVGFRAESLMPVYGLSECALAATFTAADGPKREMRVDADTLAATGRVSAGARRIVSVGTPVPGAAIDVRGDDGESASEGRVGRVWSRAPFVMHGYFGQPDASAEVIRDGWLDTGDLGFVHGGELFITGRAKDVVIIRGANHSRNRSRSAWGAWRACGRGAPWRWVSCRPARTTRRYWCSPSTCPERRQVSRRALRPRSSSTRASRRTPWCCWRRARCHARAAASCGAARRCDCT